MALGGLLFRWIVFCCLATATLIATPYEDKNNELKQRRTAFIDQIDTPERRKEFLTAEEANDAAIKQFYNGDWSEKLLGQMSTSFAVYESFLKDSIPGLIVARSIALAQINKANGDFLSAESILATALTRARKNLGQAHPDTARVLRELGKMRLDAVFRTDKELIEASAYFKEAGGIFKATNGASSTEFGSVAADYAFLRAEQGAIEEGATLIAQALKILKASVGEKHPSYADGLLRSSQIERKSGHADAIGKLDQEAMNIYRDTFTIFDPRFDALAIKLYTERIEDGFTNAFGVLRDIAAEEPPFHNALVQLGLGTYYHMIYDFARAEGTFQRALTFFEKRPGKSSGEYLKTLLGLCENSISMGDLVKAETRCQEAATRAKSRLGDKHAVYAIALTHLGALNVSRDPARAHKYLIEALKIQADLSSDNPYHYYAGLTGIQLARIFTGTGQLREATEILEQAGELLSQRPAIGFAQYQAFHAYRQAALLYWLRGERPMAKKYTSITLNNDERYFWKAGLISPTSQRESVRTFRQSFDLLTSIISDTSLDAEKSELYRHTLLWKGALFHRYAALQKKRNSDPNAREYFDRLFWINKVIADFTFMDWPDAPLAAIRQETVNAYVELKEELELQALDELIDKDVRVVKFLDYAQLLRTSLPADAVVVDILQYDHIFANPQHKPITESRYLAFVAARKKPIRLIPLGPCAEIDSHVRTWRRYFADQSGQEGYAISLEEAQASAKTLREKIWMRVQSEIGEAITIVYSPDGELSLLPIAALPAQERGHYLLEELASEGKQLIYATSIRELPELLASHRKPPTSSKFLLMGNVAFDARPIESDLLPSSDEFFKKTEPAGGPSTDQVREFFRNTPGGHRYPILDTKDEVDTISSIFTAIFPKDSELFLKERVYASTANFRKLAPQARWIHLATHGYYDPQAVDSEKKGAGGTFNWELPEDEIIAKRFETGLHSGVVLAGASLKRFLLFDTGLLTSDEIASLDLRGVDLVVLSACETATGKVEPGEGVLGVQRGFQAAGVKSTVGALWRVDSLATSLIMKQFYTNLWVKKMPVAKALQAAQLSLVKMEMPPQFWGAFIASGDWR